MSDKKRLLHFLGFVGFLASCFLVLWLMYLSHPDAPDFVLGGEPVPAPGPPLAET